MNATTTLAQQQMAAAAPAASVSGSLSTEPKRMAIIQGWDAICYGTRKYRGTEGFVAIHNSPHSAYITGACKSTDTLRGKLLKSSMLEGLLRQSTELEDDKGYFDFDKEHDARLRLGAGMDMARVAQFIPGQTDIRDYVPFLNNRDNVKLV